MFVQYVIAFAHTNRVISYQSSISFARTSIHKKYRICSQQVGRVACGLVLTADGGLVSSEDFQFININITFTSGLSLTINLFSSSIRSSMLFLRQLLEDFARSTSFSTDQVRTKSISTES